MLFGPVTSSQWSEMARWEAGLFCKWTSPKLKTSIRERLCEDENLGNTHLTRGLPASANEEAMKLNSE